MSASKKSPSSAISAREDPRPHFHARPVDEQATFREHAHPRTTRGVPPCQGERASGGMWAREVGVGLGWSAAPPASAAFVTACHSPPRRSRRKSESSGGELAWAPAEDSEASAATQCAKP
eukprot:scaffold179_cov368-Prasinococcus_capsulatus_cf.AAC.9